MPDWFGDATVFIGRSSDQFAYFNVGPHSVSVQTPGYSGYYHVCSVEPLAWHTYSFLTDLEQYDFFVDGQLMLHRYLYSSEPQAASPRVSWGDSWVGAGSESEWDYVRVSIVPEPAGLLAGILAVVAFPSTGRQGVIT